MSTWHAGDTLVIRTIANSDGSVVSAIPALVVRDDDSLLAAFIPKGSRGMSNWVVPADQRVAAVDSMPKSSERRHVPVETPHSQLRLYLPGERFSLGTIPGSQSWYGNLEAPFERTPIGIDTRDFALDVMTAPDGSWRWKDEEEFQRRLDVGVDSGEHQARVRAAGEKLISRFERRSWPFDSGWETWAPDPTWAQPLSLPPEWSVDFGTDRTLERAC